MAWLTSPTPDPDKYADIKALEQFINARTLRIVEELVTLGDQMTWATSTQKKSLVDAKVAFTASRKLVPEVGCILGTMLANALLTTSAAAASQPYRLCRSTLSSVPLSSSVLI